MSDDPFEPVYSPKKIYFWLAHWEELYTLVHTPKSSAHIAEHLNREWELLLPRLRYCLCHELHAVDSRAVDPACSHEPSGGGSYKTGPETALCIYADLIKASEQLPPAWSATQQIWLEQMVPVMVIKSRAKRAERQREPAFARTLAVERMARYLGWGQLAGKIA